MGRGNKDHRLDRLMRLARILVTRRTGMTVKRLVAELTVSRSTLYRDIATLERAGFAVVHEKRNGEARYSLQNDRAPLPRTANEAVALVIAKVALEPLTGTRVYDALNAISNGSRSDGRVNITNPRAVRSGSELQTVATIEQAISERLEIEAEYQGTSDDGPAWRVLSPVELRVHDGQLYVVAHDEGTAKFKTFKVARFSRVRFTGQQTEARAVYDSDRVHAHTMGVWSGDPIDVVVRIATDVARFAQEWPLSPTQLLENDEQGAIVRARVAGTAEVMRWVLRWGRNAEVLEPPVLRAKVEAELTAALGQYQVVP